MRDTHQVEAIIDGIIDYLESIKSLDLLPVIAQKLTEQGWIRVDLGLAEVYSRIRLTTEQKTQIQMNLSRYFQRPIRVKNKIDPAIIAGLIINVGGKTINATVNRRLEELKKKVLYD